MYVVFSCFGGRVCTIVMSVIRSVQKHKYSLRVSGLIAWFELSLVLGIGLHSEFYVVVQVCLHFNTE